MIRTRDEYQNRPEAKKPDGQRPLLEMLRQTAIRTELLTGSPEWDSFLGYAQAAMEETEAQLQGWIVFITNPVIVDRDQIMQAKIALAECKGRIDAWKAVIELPKDLIETGNKAKGLLERMAKDDKNVVDFVAK